MASLTREGADVLSIKQQIENATTVWLRRTLACATISPRFYLSSITKGSHAGQRLAFQKFQRGSASRTAMGNLVFRIILLACSGGVTTANHCDGACSSCSNNSVHKCLGTNLKFRHLEDTHWSVPNDGLGGIHCCLLDLAVLSKLRGDGEVHWQN